MADGNQQYRGGSVVSSLLLFKFRFIFFFIFFAFYFIFIFFKFNFIFKLYIIVLVLPNIKMNPPQVKQGFGELLSHSKGAKLPISQIIKLL